MASIVANCVACAGLDLPASVFSCRKSHRYSSLHIRCNTKERPCLPVAPRLRLPGSGQSSNVLRGWSPTVPIRYAHYPERAQQWNIRPETGSSDVGLRIRPEPYHRKQFQLTPFAVQRQAVSGALPADSDLGQNKARRAPISKCPNYRGDAGSAAAPSGGE